MKKNNSKYITNLVNKIITETLEDRADSLVSKIKTNVNELGGMDDDHPTFGKLNFSDMSDEEIESLLKRPVKSNDDKSEDEWKELGEESEVCECGGNMYEGVCNECGYGQMEENIYDVDDLDSNNEFDYVQEEEDVMDFEDDTTEEKKENKDFCKYQKKMFGIDDERYQEKCLGGSATKDLAGMEINMNEKLVGNQNKIDKNKNGKIDSEDFKMLRKESKKTKSVLTLTESEMIDLIEKIVLEEKEKIESNIKNLTEPKGLSAYKKAVKVSGKENDDYIKSVGKKMKEYLKDGSNGEYETNPKHFPKNNGQIEKMKKMAYEVSKDGEEFLDDYMRPGMENLDYDEMHPNEDWMKDNIEGSARTGNNPEWANAEETDLGKKLNKKRKENKFAKAKRAAYNKSPQPVVSDKPGQESGKGLDIKIESTESKGGVKLNEEFEKMKSLISYDRKTQ
jgi:hypothetical protein